jgi:hypothetical protein
MNCRPNVRGCQPGPKCNQGGDGLLASLPPSHQLPSLEPLAHLSSVSLQRRRPLVHKAARGVGIDREREGERKAGRPLAFMPCGAPGMDAAIASSCSGGIDSIILAMFLSNEGSFLMASVAACTHTQAPKVRGRRGQGCAAQLMLRAQISIC